MANENPGLIEIIKMNMAERFSAILYIIFAINLLISLAYQKENMIIFDREIPLLYIIIFLTIIAVLTITQARRMVDLYENKLYEEESPVIEYEREKRKEESSRMKDFNDNGDLK